MSSTTCRQFFGKGRFSKFVYLAAIGASVLSVLAWIQTTTSIPSERLPKSMEIKSRIDNDIAANLAATQTPHSSLGQHTERVTPSRSTSSTTGAVTPPSADLDFERCPDIPARKKPRLEREPQLWQNVDGRNVTVFSAYVDERTNVGGPMVRVVASGLQSAYNNMGPLYCQLWYEGLESPVAYGPAEYDVIYSSTLHPEMWVAHFVLCRLPSEKLVRGTPSVVSVVGQRCAAEAGNHLLISEKKQQEHDNPSFALCLPVLYGR